jgi:hypothetical protein
LIWVNAAKAQVAPFWVTMTLSFNALASFASSPAAQIGSVITKAFRPTSLNPLMPSA